MKEILITAKRVSNERGYTMYIIYDSVDGSFGFTQERNIFLYNTQTIIGEVIGDDYFNY